jgi:hypothetical protein
MPYTGPEDASLPANVKKLPLNKRKQWVEVFNSAMAKHKPEGTAMMMANGVASKELADIDEGGDKEHVHGEKCGGDCVMPSAVYESPPPPLGGATSFSDYDIFEKAHELDENVRELRYAFNDIMTNIWSDENLTLAEKGAAVAKVAQDLADRIAAGPDMGQKSFVEKAKEFFGLKKHLPKVKEIAEQDSAIWVIADKETGRPRWFAVHSNRYQDREGEIFPESRHKAYEAYVDRTHDFPEIRAWHVPGSRFGKADFIGYADGFMTSSGLFDEGMEYVAENLKALNEVEPQGVSHGYYYPEEGLIDGVYEGGYRTHEITVLPQKNASNWWTSISNVKEVLMGYTADKAAYLDKLVGPEKRKAVEKNLKELDEVLAGSGIGLKEITEAFASKDAPAVSAEAPAPSQAVAPVPVAEAAKPEAAAPAPQADAAKPADELPKDPAAGEESAAEKAIGGIVERIVTKAMEPVIAQQSVMATAIKELQRTDDEKVADTIAGKKSTPLDAQRPSEGNTLSEKEAAEKGRIDPNDDPAKAFGEDGGPVAPYLMQLVGGAGRGRIPQS